MARNRPKKQKKRLVVQLWTISEQGMGRRPDGYSLHLSVAARDAFVQEICGEPQGAGPASHAIPDGPPYSADVGADIHKRVQATKHGKRYFGDPPRKS